MNITTINTLNIAAQHLNLWLGSLLFIIGNVGCFISLIIFHSKSFKKTSFSVYFLAISVADVCLINFVLLTRILQKGFSLPLYETYEYMCKLRAYVASLTSLLSFQFFTFLCIDRFLSTHPNASYRSWANNYSLAVKIVVGITFFWMIILSHRLISYHIDPESNLCSPQNGIFHWFNYYLESIITGLVPPLTILVISLMIIRNIRSVVNRRLSSVSQQILIIEGKKFNRISRLQKLNNQLTTVLIIQLCISFVSFLPYSSDLFYFIVTQYIDKSYTFLAWENVFIQFIGICSYIFYATNSYVLLLSSPVFRKRIRHMISHKKKLDFIC